MTCETIELQSCDWRSYVFKGLMELFEEKIGHDAFIYGGNGGELTAHSCVLMASSPTLKTWLAGDSFQDLHSVEIASITYDTWRLVLDFMYKGQVTVDKEALAEVIDASEKLGMSHLTEACEKVLNPDKVAESPGNTVLESRTNSMTGRVSGSPGEVDHGSRTIKHETNRDSMVETLDNEMTSNEVTKPNGHLDEDSPTDLSKDRGVKDVEKRGSGEKVDLDEQPLDLTKMAKKEGDEVKSEKPDLPVSLPVMPPLNGGLSLPSLPMGTDAPMEAITACYYNQMMQYTLLAQNLQQAKAANIANQLSLPMLPPGVQLSAMSSTTTQLTPNMGLMSMVGPSFLQPHDNLPLQDGRQRKFPCSVCGMQFKTRHVKEQHELTHTDLKPYSCNHCGFRARQKAVIWRHKKNKHPGVENSVSLDVLTMLSGDEQVAATDLSDGNNTPSPESQLTMPDHLKTSPPNPVATNIFSTPISNSIATPSIPPPSGVAASLPRRPFMLTDSSKPYICNHCGRGFKNKYILSQHNMTHSDVRRYKCEICGFRAKQMSVIYNHKRNKHGGRKGPYQRNGSAMSNSHVPAFNPVNMSAGSAITPPVDAKPPASAMNHTNEGSLKEIELEVQNAERTPLGYVCRICGRSLKTKMILQEHMMTHYNIRRYPCGYCNYRAKQRAGLYNHVKVKHRELTQLRPLQQMISSSFKYRRSCHKRNPFMPSRRKYACLICRKSFKTNHILQQHRLIHFNVKKYSCKLCGFKARLKPAIYQHNRDQHFGQRSQVMDLLKPKVSKTKKSPPRLPKFSVTPKNEPSDQEKVNWEELSQRHAEINDKLRRQPMAIAPKINERPTEVGDVSAITSKLKSQILPQQMQLPSINSLPQMLGTNLVYNIALQGQQQQRATVNSMEISPPSPSSAQNKLPPALFGSYGTSDRPHRCKFCGRCFRLRHVMEQHELTHSEFRKYFCDICGFRAKQKAVIYRHKKVKHRDAPGPGKVAVVPEAEKQVGKDRANRQQSTSPTEYPQLIPVSRQISPPTNGDIGQEKNISGTPKGLPFALSEATRRIQNGMRHAWEASQMIQGSFQVSSPSTSKIASPKGLQPGPMMFSPPTSNMLRTPNGSAWFAQQGRDDNEEDDEELSDFSPGQSLTTNMALGLPSMAPSSTINLSLPPMSSVSPGEHSPTGDSDKKYACGVCARSFKHRHVLEQHYITHTDERPYKCEFCDFRARQKASLWRHKQKHINVHFIPPPQQ